MSVWMIIALTAASCAYMGLTAYIVLKIVDRLAAYEKRRLDEAVERITKEST